jgi:hypothetical protein
MAIIWYQKKEFVQKSIDMNIYGSEVYLWVDVGCMRSNKYLDAELFHNVRDFYMQRGKIYIG